MPGPALKRQLDLLRWPLKAFALAAGLVALAFTIGHSLGVADDVVPHTIVGFRGDGVLGGRARWDSYWYTLVATDGYSRATPFDDFSTPAFFPGFPLTMRLVGIVTRDLVLAGILVSLVAGAAATCALYRWTERRAASPVARATVVTFLVFPFSFYLFGVVYSDALFVAAAFWAFVLLDEDHVVAATICGALASGTRVVGLAVAAALVVRLLDNRGVMPAWWHRGREDVPRPGGVPPGRGLGALRAKDLVILLSFAGVLGYCAYLWWRFGDPLLFRESAKAWGEGEGLRALFKLDTLDLLGDTPYMRVEVIFQSALMLGFLALVPAVIRRFGWSYGMYALLVLGLPAITKVTFYGGGRYVLAAFPCFVVIADWLRQRPPAARWVGATSASVLLLSVLLFGRGLYIS